MYKRSLVHFRPEDKQLLRSRRFPGDGALASIGCSAPRLLGVLVCVWVSGYNGDSQFPETRFGNSYKRLLASWVLTSLSLSCAHVHCICEAVAFLCKSLQKDGTCFQAAAPNGGRQEDCQVEHPLPPACCGAAPRRAGDGTDPDSTDRGWWPAVAAEERSWCWLHLRAWDSASLSKEKRKPRWSWREAERVCAESDEVHRHPEGSGSGSPSLLHHHLLGSRFGSCG
ncbi:hypothetical protein AV530_001861 [Patagioenas fasciata monilis]|uniref:Uncharacterized protein n=1 Tax=Patagioenas fasciata monilis TaxID=372326 RepID=A0A1V4J6C4_PATFA|nr:hypothetical protein AV530_001861 [Patagioenas fasciata monilis]